VTTIAALPGGSRRAASPSTGFATDESVPDTAGHTVVAETTDTSEPSAVTTWDAELEQLYEDEMPAAIHVAYLMTGRHALAEDIAQDAFLRVAARIRRLRDPAAFRSYLRRAVVNGTNSHFRHQRVRRRYLEREGSQPPAHAGEPDLETRDAVTTALAELPHRQRAAIVCRYFLDLTEKETAKALGVRAGTVKSCVSRALTTLRAHLADPDEAPRRDPGHHPQLRAAHEGEQP